MKKKIRVLHIVEAFSTLSETFIYNNLISLEHLHKVDNLVVTLKREMPEERPFEKVYLIHSRSPCYPKRLILSALYRLRLLDGFQISLSVLQRQLELIINKTKPDLVHAHFGTMGYLALKVCKKLDIPLTTSYYGYDVSQLPKVKKWETRLAKLWKYQNSLSIVLSEEMKATIKKLGESESRIEIIHLGSSPKISFKKTNFKKPTKWLNIGRLTEKKGQLDTIQVFHSLISKGHNITLDIIGKGHLEESLQNYIDTHKLGRSIRLLGAIPNSEIIKTIGGYDAFILTSKTAPNGDKEGTPVVLMEAMAAGLPCVSTIHAGIPEIFPEELHYLLAEEGNLMAIERCIEILLSTDKESLKHISVIGKNRIQKEFNQNKEAQKQLSIYRRLLSRQSG